MYILFCVRDKRMQTAVIMNASSQEQSIVPFAGEWVDLKARVLCQIYVDGTVIMPYVLHGRALCIVSETGELQFSMRDNEDAYTFRAREDEIDVLRGIISSKSSEDVHLVMIRACHGKTAYRTPYHLETETHNAWRPWDGLWQNKTHAVTVCCGKITWTGCLVYPHQSVSVSNVRLTNRKPQTMHCDVIFNGNKQQHWEFRFMSQHTFEAHITVDGDDVKEPQQMRRFMDEAVLIPQWEPLCVNNPSSSQPDAPPSSPINIKWKDFEGIWVNENHGFQIKPHCVTVLGCRTWQVNDVVVDNVSIEEDPLEVRCHVSYGDYLSDDWEFMVPIGDLLIATVTNETGDCAQVSLERLTAARSITGGLCIPKLSVQRKDE